MGKARWKSYDILTSRHPSVMASKLKVIYQQINMNMHQPDLEMVHFAKHCHRVFASTKWYATPRATKILTGFTLNKDLCYAFSDVSWIVLYGKPWIPFQHKQITNEILSSLGFSYKGLLRISRAIDLIQNKKKLWSIEASLMEWKGLQ